jgi:hypothetical protein
LLRIDSGGDIHRRRERVVGRLSHIDVIIGVNWGFASERRAGSETRGSGRSNQALYDEVMKDGLAIMSMKKDWKNIFAFRCENGGR